MKFEIGRNQKSKIEIYRFDIIENKKLVYWQYWKFIATSILFITLFVFIVVMYCQESFGDIEISSKRTTTVILRSNNE